MHDSGWRIEWSFLGELPEKVSHSSARCDEANCLFLIRFLDVPPGDGHCAFFAINVINTERARTLGIPPTGRRAYIVADEMTQSSFQARVEEDVARAMGHRSREEALHMLNELYVWTSQDFSSEFLDELLPADDIRALVETSFAHVRRGEGTTLHQALAEDDYASPEAIVAARKQDVDSDWHDAPVEVMASHPEFLGYLDSAGFLYYLPAAMLLSLEPQRRATSDLPQRTYWRLLPLVAVRDAGKGQGEDFDAEDFVRAQGFTDGQVRAVYRFLCFMATEGGDGVDEDQLPALRKWRTAAQRRSH